jgi:hypothetical protein
MKKVFYWLGGIGYAIITLICLIVVEEPFKIVARGTMMDYNNIMLVAVPIMFLYTIMLWGIYNLINFISNKKDKVES